ncbi:MAG: MmcQ/YjbR family DNA-binding protein [Gemmataceae bacterium]|nr:MmcQ/YjbR family DNA-binding protein [Gemmataceae bacterium]
MTADEFRALALELPEAVEDSHMGHPDFRVGGKIFATLAHESEGGGNIKLKPEQQASYVADEPEIFRPINGAWGLRGWTHVNLPNAQELTVRQALIAAWRNTAPKKLVALLE